MHEKKKKLKKKRNLTEISKIRINSNFPCLEKTCLKVKNVNASNAFGLYIKQCSILFKHSKIYKFLELEQVHF